MTIIEAPRDAPARFRLPPFLPPFMSILERIGLHRPELRAWAMYDWAASAMQTTIMVAIFPIYFITEAGAGVSEPVANQYWAISNSIAVAIIAIVSPVLGAIADFTAAKKRFLAAFTTLGVAAVAGMFFVQRGDLLLAAALFVLGVVGASGAFVFYESLLPHIAREEEIDRVSSAGYAIGYIGGGVLLALNLAWILAPAAFGLPSGEGIGARAASLPARLAFLSVAVWWALFSIPLFRRVREPARTLEPDETQRANPIRAAFARLRETFRELKGYRQAFLMLVAFLIYNDGITTIQKMATAYGTEIGIARDALISAILIVQFVGVPFALLFGMLAGRIGAKRSIFVGLLVYGGISVLGFYMRTAAHFYLLAMLVGMVQGGTQALSRSLFAMLIPRHKSGEFFGFYSVFSKFAGIFGPLLFAWVIGASGSSRPAILAVIVFFAIGALLLSFVDVKEGVRVAREAEASLVRLDGGSAGKEGNPLAQGA